MFLRRVMAMWIAIGCTGCLNHVQIELSAAQSVQALAEQMQLTLQEYHADLQMADDYRQAAAIQAFISRTQAAANNPTELEQQAELLRQSLAQVRADRAAAWQRFTIAMDNTTVLLEIAAGLNRSATQERLPAPFF